MGKCDKCTVNKLNSLKELTKDELHRISHCKTSHVIKKGEVIFEEGEHVDGVYCIKSGVCKVSKMSENGRDQIIHLMKKGDLLGERSLINDEVANLKAIAVNDMEVCFIPKEEIISDLHGNNNFSMSVLRGMASALKSTDATIVRMGQKTVKQRLAQTLLYLNETFGVDENDTIALKLSREDIANIVGTATETAIRLLSQFNKLGFISLKGKKITILKKGALRAIVEE